MRALIFLKFALLAVLLSNFTSSLVTGQPFQDSDDRAVNIPKDSSSLPSSSLDSDDLLSGGNFEVAFMAPRLVVENDRDNLDGFDNTLEVNEPSETKRACIRRGGNCDHRPNDCCYNSSCRCNLWGSNCRCQRMGLFQKWG